MDIKRAKEEVRNTVRAYLAKDAFGQYEIPAVHQRPVLLIGPPGIGKTAIMEQVARECGINLVSYSITHHTRQSAIGLPFIEKRTYGGHEYSVTEYTISEIIASMYDRMEQTGIREGILFLDEINCVSETLAPAMLQFLQAKTFGAHRVPEGWIIAAAGNPPEYNKSVREFDIVTLDRVKKIVTEENYAVWREYALAQGVHPAILAYLDIRPEHFYRVQRSVDGMQFVTARGWEDLSRLIAVYETLGLAVDEAVVAQYLQHPAIAKDFAAYLELYRRYEAEYDAERILCGQTPPKVMARVQKAGFDERLSVIGLLLDKLCGKFRAFYEQDAQTVELYEVLKAAKPGPQTADGTLLAHLTQETEKREADLSRQEAAGQTDRRQSREARTVIAALRGYVAGLQEHSDEWDDAAGYDWLRDQFAALPAERTRRQEAAAAALECAFDFMEAAFGAGQEMVIFVTELTMRAESRRFIRENGCARYYTYNQELLAADKRNELAEELRKL